MRPRRASIVLLVLALLLGSTVGAAADDAGGELLVTPGTSIQAVLDAAAPGDVVRVAPGTYPGPVVLRTDAVRLLGPNAGRAGYDPGRGEEAVIDAGGAGFAVTIGQRTFPGVHPEDVEVAGLSVTGFSEAGIAQVHGAARVDIRDNLVLPPPTGTRSAIQVSGGTGSRITGNQVGPATGEDGRWSGTGISALGSVDATIAANRIVGGDLAITVAAYPQWAGQDPAWGAASGNRVTGNEVVGRSGVLDDGIAIRGAVAESRVVDNRITDRGRALFQEPQLGGTPTGTVIRDNEIRGARNGVEVIGGTVAALSDNAFVSAALPVWDTTLALDLAAAAEANQLGPTGARLTLTGPTTLSANAPTTIELQARNTAGDYSGTFLHLELAGLGDPTAVTARLVGDGDPVALEAAAVDSERVRILIDGDDGFRMRSDHDRTTTVELTLPQPGAFVLHARLTTITSFAQVLHDADRLEVVVEPGAAAPPPPTTEPGDVPELTPVQPPEDVLDEEAEVEGDLIEVLPDLLDCAAALSDVEADGVHTPGICVLWGRDIVRGFADGRFGPGAATTRGQFATVLTGVLGLPTPARDPGFADVPAGSTHAGAIAALVTAGHSSGFADGSYRPGQPITRAQVASIVAAALDLDLSRAPASPFADVPDGTTHAAAIAVLADAGVIRGQGGERFGPGDPVTRGQLSTILAGGFDLIDG